MIKLYIILSILFISVSNATFAQDKSHYDMLLEKEKELEIKLNEIEYINQKFKRLVYSGSYYDKYRALTYAMEFCKVSDDFLNDLNYTFSKYENFKSRKDDLVQTERQLYTLQFKLTTNELEYYRLMKIRREKNDVLDSLELEIDTLMRSSILTFIEVTDSTYNELKGKNNNTKEITGLMKIIQSLKEMDKSNALETINQFYTFPMEKKETDMLFSSLIFIADSVLCQRTESLLKIMDHIDFIPFVVDYLKVKEKFSYSPNVPVLSSFEFVENKFATNAEIIFRKYIKTTLSQENCTDILLIDSIGDNKTNEVKYYLRNQPIKNEEINLFYISQKEFTTFTFDEEMTDELKNKIMNYFSIWSGFDILSKKDKKYIIGLLNNPKNENPSIAKIKSSFKISSDDELKAYLEKNEFYKLDLSQLQKTGVN